MKIEVSIGEAIDKLSILEIKLLKISDENKKLEITKEINLLNDCQEYKIKYELYYNMLIYVNQKIWDLTDIIKSIHYEDSNFACISNKIFEYNQKRFRIKNFFNTITNSFIKEQKSYVTNCCTIVVDNEHTFFNKLPEIYYLSIEYDNITFESPILDVIKNFLKIPNIIYDTDNTFIKIELNNFIIPSYEDKTVFILKPITYIIGGMFGDFIYGLSVINEKFYETGRKGVLYLSEQGDCFRNGLINTYNDTFNIISNQPYIQEFKIFNNEQIDINLITWRSNPNLYNQNWYNTYKQTYNIEWGTKKWLTVPYDKKWENKIIINTTSYRWPNSIDFQHLYNLYNTNLIFIYSDENQKNHFINTTKLNIENYKFNTFLELTTIINSCKLFVGSMSAPLSIAHALHKTSIGGLINNSIDNIFIIGLDSIFNLKYSV
jgi:hypothetical protein